MSAGIVSNINSQVESLPAVAVSDKDATPDDLTTPPETIQISEEEQELGAASDKDQSDVGKLKTLLGILKRMIGVKDIAAIRLSLPANLLEPVPNLEYWNYLERPDLLTLVADLDDPLDRMLAVLRFTFTKDLKFIKANVCKPYNSILGEHFRCHWEVDPLLPTEDAKVVPVQALSVDSPESLPLAGLDFIQKKKTPSAESPPFFAIPDDKPSQPAGLRVDGTSSKKGRPRFLGKKKANNDVKEPQTNGRADSLASAAFDDTADASSISPSIKTTRSAISPSKQRIAFLTEQVSHHPPISSFFADAKQAGVQLYGVDQLGAKYTGTSVKVFPGVQNKGIFLRLTKNARCGAAGEEYQITHPNASINGLLRGRPWVAICDSFFATCRGGKRDQSGGDNGARLRAIVEYKDEGWITKAKYALEGCIYEYNVNDDSEEYTSGRQVPLDKVVATLEGCWRGKITYKRKGDKESRLLINLEELDPIPRSVRPLESQDEMESRRIWEPVTSCILSREFGEATKNKQQIEQRQRDLAAERKRKCEVFIPRFFDADISDGRPQLTAEGRKAIDGEFDLEGYDLTTNKAVNESLEEAPLDDDDQDDFKDAED